MLDLVKDEWEHIDSRFLEPACGSGNFLVPVLERTLATVQGRHGGSDFETRHHALLAVMSIYGIELLADDVIVGNPPYQLDDGGFGASAEPIYSGF